MGSMLHNLHQVMTGRLGVTVTRIKHSVFRLSGMSN